jgi:hypothetical protein
VTATVVDMLDHLRRRTAANDTPQAAIANLLSEAVYIAENTETVTITVPAAALDRLMSAAVKDDQP